MSRLYCLVFAIALGLIAAAAPALAKDKKDKDVTDLTGVWKGESESVAMGKLGHTEATDSPKFLHISWTLTIDKQEGRAFYGTRASAKAKETVVGIVDGATVTMADDDGTYVGKITGKNSMIIKYLEAGTNSKVASITRYVREGAESQ